MRIKKIKKNKKYEKLIPRPTDKQFKVLKQDIKENGVEVLLVVNQDNVLLDGYTRYNIAEELNLSTLPVKQKSFENKLNEKYYIIRVNKNRRHLTDAQRAKLIPVLKETYKKLSEERQKATLKKGDKTSDVENLPQREKGKTRDKIGEELGISGKQVEKIECVEDNKDKLPEEDYQKWQEGDKSTHQLYNKIKRRQKEEEKQRAKEIVEKQKNQTKKRQPVIYKKDALQFLQMFEDGEIKLLLTDPPYSTDVEDLESFVEWVPKALQKLSQKGFAYIFIGSYPEEIYQYLKAIRNTEGWSVNQLLVWTYRNTLGRNPKKIYKLNYQTVLFIRGKDAPDLDAPKTSEKWSVQDVNAPDGRFGKRFHKWEKPKKLLERFIRHSTKEGDLVVDAFAGTGSISLVASELGRRNRACENDEKMLRIAEKRGAKYN